MGWVSLLEDAVKRFESDLHRLQREPLEDLPPAPTETKKDIREIIHRGEAVLFEALKHLELATDPSIELAALVRDAEAERDLHKTRIWEFQKTSEALVRALNKERERAKHLEEQVANLKVQNNRLERRLEQVMRENPSAIYGAFMKGSQSKSGS